MEFNDSTKNQNTNSNFSFVKYDELGIEQKNAINLNALKDNLIIGAAGTGKTLIAIYRAHELYNQGIRDIKLLMYNRSLQMYVKAVRNSMGWEDEFSVYTVNDFAFYRLFSGSKENPHNNGIKSSYIPNKEGSKYGIDWIKAYNEYKDDDFHFNHIIIDEGQDFPKEFFKFIKKVAKNVTILADPNQSLQDDTCRIDEILTEINRESYYSLTLNYRNSEKLSDWTRKYCYDKSIFAESYRAGEDIEIIDYDRTKLYENIVNIVKKYSPNTNIGIIIPREDTTNEKEKRKLGNKIYDELKNELGNEYKVGIYQNEKTNNEELQRDNVDFGVPSIKIFNYLTVKGLDFDVAILLDNVNLFEIEKNNKAQLDMTIKNMNRLYVSATRAKEKLYIIYMNDKDDHFVYKDNSIDVNYSKYPEIGSANAKECLDKAIAAKENNEFGKALYYVHYAISVIGFKNVEQNKEAITLFAFLCDKFNKSDFGLSIIANYSENTGDINDERLIYFYNLFLIDSYNARYLYNIKVNTRTFFKRLSNIESVEFKSNLLSKFYKKYKEICAIDNLPLDDKLGLEYIEKYDISGVRPIYDSFKDSIVNNPKTKVNYARTINIDKKEFDKIKKKARELGAHKLLNGSKIIVFGDSTIGPAEYSRYAKEEYGYEEDDFDFYLNYNDLKNAHLGIEKNSSKYAAILIGPSPHSHRDKEAFENTPGYPKTFVCGYGGKFSLQMFENGLFEITEYLKEKYTNMQVYNS